MRTCPGCQNELKTEAPACDQCGMRFDQDELVIDWAAIDAASAQPRRPLAQKIMPTILFLSSIVMLGWLAQPYLPITEYILDGRPGIDLRAHLKEQMAFPEPGRLVQGTGLTLGYKGAEWKRIRRFAITRDDMVYIQVIGAVCPYEMPRKDCRKVLIEVPKEGTDFERFRPASAIDVRGRLHRIEKDGEFAPLIPFLAQEMRMDAEGAYIIADGVTPGWGRDATTFWGVVVALFLLLLGMAIRTLRS